MFAPVPRHRIPNVAAWLAAEGFHLLTAPASLVVIALSEPTGGIDDNAIQRPSHTGPDNERSAFLAL